jgi:hypothetical protein
MPFRALMVHSSSAVGLGALLRARARAATTVVTRCLMPRRTLLSRAAVGGASAKKISFRAQAVVPSAMS